MKGKVKFFDGTKGFGFVVADDGTEYFVHQSKVAEGTILRDNDDVVFELGEGRRPGEQVAVDVKKDEGNEQPAEQQEEEQPAEEDEESDEQPEEETEEEDLQEAA